MKPSLLVSSLAFFALSAVSTMGCSSSPGTPDDGASGSGTDSTQDSKTGKKSSTSDNSCVCNVTQNGVKESIACGESSCVAGTTFSCGATAQISEGDACTATIDDTKDGGVSATTKDSGASVPKVTAVSITGKFTVTCTAFQANISGYECDIVPSAVTMTPALTAGQTLDDALDIASENLKTLDTGWTGGLKVISSFPATCKTYVNLGKKGFHLQVSTKTEAGTSCGLTTFSAATFASSFKATMTGSYVPTKSFVDIAVDLKK